MSAPSTSAIPVNLNDLTIHLVEQIDELVRQHYSDAVSLAQSAVRINCIENLAIGFFILGLIGVLWRLRKLCWRMALSLHRKGDGIAFIPIIGAAGLLFGAIFLLINAIGHLFVLWTWIGVFDPKLFLAHEILLKVIT